MDQQVEQTVPAAAPPRRSRRRGQKGSVIVESALVFLAFMCLLIGAIDFGQFLFVHQALVERARSSARWGAIYGPTNTDSIKNMVMYNQSTVPTDPSPYFGLTTSMISVSTAGSGTDDYRLSLAITNYPYTILSPYIAGTYNGPNILITVPLGN
jgi:Flp pilus assembly protein TadG